MTFMFALTYFMISKVMIPKVMVTFVSGLTKLKTLKVHRYIKDHRDLLKSDSP